MVFPHPSPTKIRIDTGSHSDLFKNSGAVALDMIQKYLYIFSEFAEHIFEILEKLRKNHNFSAILGIHISYNRIHPKFQEILAYFQINLSIYPTSKIKCTKKETSLLHHTIFSKTPEKVSSLTLSIFHRQNNILIVIPKMFPKQIKPAHIMSIRLISNSHRHIRLLHQFQISHSNI